MTGLSTAHAQNAVAEAVRHLRTRCSRPVARSCDTAPCTGRAPPTRTLSSCASGGFPLVGDGAGYSSWVHLDDAAGATDLAVEQQAKGVFNIVDDEPALAAEWLPEEFGELRLLLFAIACARQLRVRSCATSTVSGVC
jgi:NAD dependent epimerase/dehydratase family enzyme